MNTPSWYRPATLAAALLCGALAPSANAQVMISATETAGVDQFRIETESATYIFDKEAAFLTSILDRDGNDWVSFRPEHTPGLEDGAQGWFRGIPQLGSDFGHSRRHGAVSTTPDPQDVPLPKVAVEASREGWHATWEFFPTHARMTLHRADDNYWFLYEGTPGGRLDQGDACWRSDRQVVACDQSWTGDVVNTSGAAEGAEWVYFADGRLDRSFFLAHPDDTIPDSYFAKGWQLPGGGMTVMGFGRERKNLLERIALMLDGNAKPYQPLLYRTPEVLVLGFAESRDFDEVKQVIDRAYSDDPLDEDFDPHNLPIVTFPPDPSAS